MKSIASDLGLSRTTVYRALRGLPRISPETRARVLELVSACGYVPDLAAQNLAAGTTGCVALVVTDLGGRNRMGFAEAVISGLAKIGRDSFVFVAGDGPRFLPDVCDRLKRRRVASTIVDWELLGPVSAAPGAGGTTTLARFLAASPAATVVAWTGPDTSEALALTRAGADCVFMDLRAGLNMLVAHILECGCQRIILLAGGRDGPPAEPTQDRWMETLEPCLRLAGRDAKVSVVAADGAGCAAAYRVATEVLSAVNRRTRPDAVVVLDAGQAPAVLKALYDRGLRVPWDVSVATVGDPEANEFLAAGLTALAYPVPEVAQECVKLASQDTGRGSPGAVGSNVEGVRRYGRLVTVAPSLVVRGSTLPPRVHRDSSPSHRRFTSSRNAPTMA